MPEVTDLMRVAQWAKSAASCAGPPEVYNAACRLLDEMEAIRLGAEKLLNLSLDEGRQADEAEATIERVRAFAVELRTYCSPYGISSVYADTLETVLSGAERHGGGRNPQTQGAVEGQEAREAQGAAQCRICHGALPPGYVCGNCRTVYPKVGQPYPMREQEPTS